MRIIALIYLIVASNLVFAETYTFAFVPQQSAKKMANKWQPILDYLSDKTGDKYRFTTAKDIPTFEKRLASNTYDVAYMNPYHFTVFNASPGYQALVKQKDKRITGIIVVHKDSPVKTLEELRGATLAFPAPAAFAATLLTSAEFRKRGISIYPQYVSSHDSVYLNVSRGFMVAGGGVYRTFNNADKAVQEQLRVLWTTPKYTPHAIAVKTSLPEDAVNRLKQVMVHMHESATGKKLLNRVNFNGFEAANNADWDDVRALGIDIINQ